MKTKFSPLAPFLGQPYSDLAPRIKESSVAASIPGRRPPWEDVATEYRIVKASLTVALGAEPVPVFLVVRQGEPDILDSIFDNLPRAVNEVRALLGPFSPI